MDVSVVKFVGSKSAKPTRKAPDKIVLAEVKHASTKLSTIFDTSYPEKNYADISDFLVRTTYKNDLDIFKIHQAVRASFGSKIARIEQSQQEVDTLSRLLTGYLSYIEAEKINRKIDELRIEIANIGSGKLWTKYITEVEPIVTEYLKYASNRVKGIVRFSNIEQVDINEDVVKIRNTLITEYLIIASQYIKLDILREIESITVCPYCNIDSNEFQVNVDSGLKTCSCGYEQINIIKISSYKDSSRVSINSKSAYDDKVTFIKALDQFMGNRVPVIPPRLYEMLDAHFLNLGFYTGQYVRDNFPLLENGKKYNTTVDLMKIALSATGNSSYYYCINYLGSIYWGWILPNLADIRDLIIEDYITSQKVYDEIKDPNRSSSTNAQIRLYGHIYARGYPCEQSDFKILSCREALEYHHHMFIIMRERTGINFPNLI